MPTNHPCHPTPISWNITKDHPQFLALNIYGGNRCLMGKVQQAGAVLHQDVI